MNEREALAELVALKDLKDRLHKLHEMGHGTDYDDYHRRQPLAWAAARTALSQPAEPAPDLTDDEIIAEYCKIADGKEWAIGGLKDAMPFARAVLKAQKEKT